MARDDTARRMLTHERKPAGAACLAPPAERRIPLGYKLLAAAAVSLILWAGIFWLGGQSLAALS